MIVVSPRHPAISASLPVRRLRRTVTVLLKKAAADYESPKQRCEKFDAESMGDLRKVRGEKYAQPCALAYRQTFAGAKICADANGRSCCPRRSNPNTHRTLIPNFAAGNPVLCALSVILPEFRADCTTTSALP